MFWLDFRRLRNPELPDKYFIHDCPRLVEACVQVGQVIACFSAYNVSGYVFQLKLKINFRQFFTLGGSSNPSLNKFARNKRDTGNVSFLTIQAFFLLSQQRNLIKFNSLHFMDSNRFFVLIQMSGNIRIKNEISGIYA